MRVFIAIELEEHIKNQLNDVQSQLNTFVHKGNFTSTNNYHLTMRFIGETDMKHIREIMMTIKEIADKVNPFNLSLDSLGHFPKKQKEVIWVGVDGQAERLNELKQDLEIELEKIGFKKESFEYTPHITLVRNATIDEPFEHLQEKIRIPKIRLTVQSLSLMESIRIDDELVYRSVYKKSFQNID